MSTPYDELLNNALALPPATRVVLAEQLIESLDEAEPQEVEAAWKKEIEQRLADFRAGRIQAIPGDEVFKELRGARRK